LDVEFPYFFLAFVYISLPYTDLYKYSFFLIRHTHLLASKFLYLTEASGYAMVMKALR